MHYNSTLLQSTLYTSDILVNGKRVDIGINIRQFQFSEVMYHLLVEYRCGMNNPVELVLSVVQLPVFIVGQNLSK